MVLWRWLTRALGGTEASASLHRRALLAPLLPPLYQKRERGTDLRLFLEEFLEKTYQNFLSLLQGFHQEIGALGGPGRS